MTRIPHSADDATCAICKAMQDGEVLAHEYVCEQCQTPTCRDHTTFAQEDPDTMVPLCVACGDESQLAHTPRRDRTLQLTAEVRDRLRAVDSGEYLRPDQAMPA